MLQSEGRKRPSEIEHVWNHDGRPVFKFAGIDSISDAEAWAGADVLVEESQRAELEAGEYSHADLIGCSVAADGPIGVVKGVEQYGGPPLLRVELEGGREILVPFARAICVEIDVSGKRIVVDLPEGLREVNRR